MLGTIIKPRTQIDANYLKIKLIHIERGLAGLVYEKT